MPDLVGASGAAAPAETVLTVRDLKGWYGESHVLHGLSFTVHEGEVVTLLGRNGAGKSTTLKAIMGLLPQRQGSVVVSGSEVIAARPRHIARLGLGYVPEDRGIFAKLTVRENLMLPPLLSARGLGMDEIYQHFPNLRERLSSPGKTLSGGEQQMLSIARVLRSGARILLLDEPTEGLAPIIVQQIGTIVALLKQRGYTIVLVEQNFRFAQRLADRHLIVENGRLVDEIPNADLDSRIDTIHAYLGL